MIGRADETVQRRSLLSPTLSSLSWLAFFAFRQSIERPPRSDEHRDVIDADGSDHDRARYRRDSRGLPDVHPVGRKEQYSKRPRNDDDSYQRQVHASEASGKRLEIRLFEIRPLEDVDGDGEVR